MKGLSILIASFFILVSCNLGPNNGKTSLNDGEVWPIIETVLAEGAEISDVRPDASILSEKEILIKMAKIASEEGYLSLSHPLYSTDQPKLLNARIEAPILVHDLTVPVQDVYKTSFYLLNAIDEEGESLLHVNVNPLPDAAGDRQYGPIGITPSNATPELSRHFITKREAEKIIESQFPSKQYAGPVAVEMLFEGDVYGRSNVSWYFTVGDSSSSRSAMGGDDHKEYLINALVTKYRELPDEVTAPASRSLIDAKKSNPGFTFYSRMVQLAEPIYFLENLNNMKAGRSIMGANNPPAPARVTSVPLK
ncbi:MAG: hypothetical protein LBK63_03230 [Treponema sp.]|jgi:hypothetical protein|nr:hypothetical protein [Treponema sp.]